MSNTIADNYEVLLEKNNFIKADGVHPFNAAGTCFKLSSKVGGGYYWIYGQKDLFDIKIHDFFFHDDFFLEFELPGSLSITQYESISGEELNPYHRLTAECIKTFIGDYGVYKAIIHKKIPIRSIGIEIMPSYYEGYLKKQYPDMYADVISTFRQIDQTTAFPEMARLLYQIKNYRGEGIAANLFYESKVAEAVSLVVQKQQALVKISGKYLTNQDTDALQTITAYINDHYAYDIPLDRLSKIACMGSTKLKTSFKQYHNCTITEYIQNRRMSQAEHLLTKTDLTIGQIAQTVGYSTSSRFAELFRKNTGILPNEYRGIVRKK